MKATRTHLADRIRSRQQKSKRSTKRESAARKEEKREEEKAKMLKDDQNRRSVTIANIGELVGVTEATCPEGADQLVYAYADRRGHVGLNRITALGRPVKVEDYHVDFVLSYSEKEAEWRARDRYAQADALMKLEQTGKISTADAVMVAQHHGAWMMALRLAKHHGYYTVLIVTPLSPDAHQTAKGKLLVDAYHNIYGAFAEDVPLVALSHAASFFNSQRDDFPAAFKADEHLDFFFVFYGGQVCVKRHKRPSLDDTIAFVSARDIIINLTEALKQDDVAVFNSRVIKKVDLELLASLNPISMEHALPDSLRKKKDATLALVSNGNTPSKPDFEEWCDDAIAFLVWEDVCRVAMKGDLEEMASLHGYTEAMMNGHSAESVLNGDEVS